MAKNKLKLLAPAISLLGASLLSPAVLAADSANYGMNYTGGADLGAANVTIDKDFVDSLTPLIATNTSTVTFKGSLWKTAWQRLTSNGNCRLVHYAMITQDDPIEESDKIGFTVVDGKYRNEVSIKGTSLYGFDGTDGYAYIYMVDGAYLIQATSGNLYSTEALCTENEGEDVIMPSNNGLKTTHANQVFVKMHSELYKNNERFISNGLLLGITDIDAAQSYKILNEGNDLSKGIMHAAKAADLQWAEDNIDGDESNSNLKNKFVSSNDGSYIYSEHDPTNADNKYILKTKRSNIYVGLTEDTMRDGLDVVYGFGSKGAASGLEYYAVQHSVSYVAGENGEISGITSEKVVDSDTPSGTETVPADGYELSYWTSNVDLELADKTKIKAGEKITDEQLKLAIIEKDTNFLAHFEKGVIVPDTGAAITDDASGAKVITASVAGISIFAIAAFVLARLSHKKVDFRK